MSILTNKLEALVLLTLLEQVTRDLETALMFPAPPKPLVQKASDSLEAIVAELRKLT